MPFQVRIDIEGAKPPIWRRILVEEDIMLDEMHDILQILFDWSGAHMHHFQTDQLFIKPPDEFDSEMPMGLEVTDSASVALKDVFKKPGDEMIYIYDYGDDWVHRIVFERTMQMRDEDRPVICIGGRMESPPEDSGGIHGYYELLEALPDKNHDAHKMAVEMLGKKFDASFFDEEGINDQLTAWA